MLTDGDGKGEKGNRRNYCIAMVVQLEVGPNPSEAPVTVVTAPGLIQYITVDLVLVMGSNMLDVG